MTTTTLSSKGQVIIPKSIRMAHHWEVGQEFTVVESGDGILLKPATPFKEVDLSSVAGCLKYNGTPKSTEEINAALEQGIKERWS